MTPNSVTVIVLSAALTGLLTWAAISDIRDRKIPNLAVLAVLALFIPWTLTGQPAALGGALAAGGIGLAVCYGLYAVSIIGAGDAKLFAAVALFAGLGYLPTLALATVLAGGAIAAVSIATRPRRALVMLNLRGKGDFGRGIPYGVAIAIGGTFVQWGRLLHLIPSQPFG
jgi:prepilin peptidase CpaA